MLDISNSLSPSLPMCWSPKNSILVDIAIDDDDALGVLPITSYRSWSRNACDSLQSLRAIWCMCTNSRCANVSYHCRENYKTNKGNFADFTNKWWIKWKGLSNKRFLSITIPRKIIHIIVTSLSNKVITVGIIAMQMANTTSNTETKIEYIYNIECIGLETCMFVKVLIHAKWLALYSIGKYRRKEYLILSKLSLLLVFFNYKLRMQSTALRFTFDSGMEGGF